MSTLRIFLFGGVRVFHDDLPPVAKITHRVQALLAYLLLQSHHGQPRDALTDLFWGDHSQERARNCLNTTLWRLRSALEPAGIPHGTYLVTTPSGGIGFNWESDYWLDTQVFEKCTNCILACPISGMETSDAQDLENALRLYADELLDGFYDDWALRERERMRCLYLNSLAQLMRYYRQHGAYEKGLTCGQQILNLDPLREEVHREIMWLYLAMGQRAMAVKQYEMCRRILAKELGIPPMEETEALYNRILQGSGAAATSHATLPGPDSLGLALQQLRESMEALHDAQDRVRQAAQMVERLTGRHDA